MHLRMSVGKTRRGRLFGDNLACLAIIYFLLVDLHPLLISRLQISLSLLAHSTDVDVFGRPNDVLLDRNPFLILGHFGFPADVGRFDLDSPSSLMPDDDYSNLHALLPNQTPLLSLLYSIIFHSVDYIDQLYSLSAHLVPDIPFPDSPIFHSAVREPYV